MDYEALKTLINTHPDPAGTSDAELAAWCNEEAISRDRSTVPAAEVCAVILDEYAEWTALSTAEQTVVRDILYLSVNDGVPTEPGNAIRNRLVQILGTATKGKLAGVISEDVSRAENLGIIGNIRIGDIEYARTM